MIDEVREMKRHPARDAAARGGHEAVNRGPALENIDVRRCGRGGVRLLARDQRVQNRRERQLVVARRDQLGERIGGQLADAVAQRRGIVGRDLLLGDTSCSRAARRSASCGNRRLPRGDVQQRLALRLDAEQARDERAQRPRHLDQQRRFVGRRQRRAVAVSREAAGQRRVARGQRRAELRVQRGQPLGLVEIAVTEAVDTEREVSRLVARRAPGAVREGKLCRRQRLSS